MVTSSIVFTAVSPAQETLFVNINEVFFKKVKMNEKQRDREHFSQYNIYTLPIFTQNINSLHVL